MKTLIKRLIFGVSIIASLGLFELLEAARVVYNTTRNSSNARRRRVVYRDRGSRAGDVLAPAATGALIGGIAGGGRGAGIGAGVGLGLGLLGSSRPRYREEVVYEYDEPEEMYDYYDEED